MQFFILRIIREDVLAVVERAVADRAAVNIQGEGFADVRRLDTSDTRDLIAALRIGYYIIAVAGENEVIAALKVERQGGLGFQREGSALKGRAFGKILDDRIGYGDRNVTQLFSPAVRPALASVPVFLSK